MVLEKPILIDCRDHLHGRLASVVAKELLAGQKIILVRCEEMVISGSLVRNQTKYAQFRNKRMNTNPKRGPFHFKSPARIVWRTIRGMVHQKTARGQGKYGAFFVHSLLMYLMMYKNLHPLIALLSTQLPLDVFPPSRVFPTPTIR